MGKNTLLPSGKQSIFTNRLGWALTHLNKAILIESIKKGTFHITQRGLDLLRNDPEYINIKILNQYPEFLKFKGIILEK